VSTSILSALEAALGPDAVHIADQIPPRAFSDMAGLAPVAPLALLLPRSTEDVAATLTICAAHRQPLVIQGGLTGLAGGAHPGPGEIALSLERMTGIEEIDLSSGTMTVLAGTPLQVVQEAAAAAGMMCGIDLGARGSCTIGGNVATNAGGNQVVRYGMTRRNVLGLEAVLADGQVVRSLNKMAKNNTGYDWTQLLIGSEGTLGVVTRVTLVLHPRPADVASALVAVGSTTDAIALMRALQAGLPSGLLTFEAMWREFYEIATLQMGLTAPLPQGHDVVLLIEAPTEPGSDALDEALAAQMEHGIVRDAVVARSEADRRSFWALRDSVYDHARRFGPWVGFDVSIPLDRMPAAIDGFRAAIPARFSDGMWVVFGHLADSNVHVNVIPQGAPEVDRKQIETTVYEVTRAQGGSISAEHGIGRTKRDYLHLSRTPTELALMATIKRALDPGNILNPGRVLAPASDGAVAW
jgi:FAD/FMN-containing dehydrogenase